jgi:hypothetical protein
MKKNGGRKSRETVSLKKALHSIIYLHGDHLTSDPGPTCQDAKPRVDPGVYPPHLLYKSRGESRVKPGVWRPEIWAL